MTIRGAMVVVLLGFASANAAAQQEPSLGDLARRIEAARAQPAQASRIYTNADLVKAPEPPPPATPGGAFMSESLGKPVTAEEIVSRSEEKVAQDEIAAQSEAQWRQRAESVRMQLTPLLSRLQSLQVPNSARDANPSAKARQESQIRNVQTGISGLEKQWTSLEQSARGVKIPMQWLEPRPVFPPR